MVSTRRTKRPSFGDASAAPTAPATPATATRGKRPRAAAATPTTTKSATSARGKQQPQQRRGRTKVQQSDEEKDDEAIDSGAADDEAIINNSAEQEEKTAEVDTAQASGEGESETITGQQAEEQAANEEAGADGTAADKLDEAEVEERADDDEQLDDDAELNQPRVSKTSTAQEGDGEAEDGADEEEDEEDDGVDEDDEYNFDADHEPLAPPTTTHRRTAQHDDDDDDDDNLRRKEVRQPAPQGLEEDEEGGDATGATTKFGATLSALLHQPTASLASPLLAAAPLLPIPRDPAAAADRALRLKQRARREWRERAHREEVQYDEVERRLVRVATRGVVQLFNAVQQHRRAGRMQAAAEEKDRTEIVGRSKQAEMSQEGFMQLIRTAPKVERAEEHKSSAREGVSGKSKGGEKGAGWSVLNEDYMLGGKLTDWDKQVDESEDEDELEAQQEMEVE